MNVSEHPPLLLLRSGPVLRTGGMRALMGGQAGVRSLVRCSNVKNGPRDDPGAAAAVDAEVTLFLSLSLSLLPT